MDTYNGPAHKRNFQRCVLLWTITLVVAVSAFATDPAVAAGDSFTFSYSGRLTEANGAPIRGPVSLSVSFYHSATGGSPVLTVTDGLSAVPLQEGIFQFSLTLSGSDFHAAFPSVTEPVYIEVTDLTNAPDTPYDRQLVAMVPYAAKVPVDDKTLEFNSIGQLTLKSSALSGQTAISSINASSSGTIAPARLPTMGGDLSGTVDAATVTKLLGRPISTTTPNNDEFLKWNGTSWIPAPLAGASGGTVTSISTGQGLSGGPITASGTIDLQLNAAGGLSKTLGAGTNELGIAAGGVTPAMLSTTGCNTDGKILKVSSGAWVCGDDVGLASGSIVNADIAAGAAIADSKLAQITTANKVADSALSSTVTKLGSDIDLSSTEVTNTLPVSKGGTGATTLTGIPIGNGTSAMTAVAGTASQYLRRNATNDGYEFVSLGDAAAKNTGTGAGDVAAGNHSHANAVAGTSAGFMSAADKTALDGLSAGAVMDADFGSQGIMLRGASAGSYSILTDNSSNWNTAYTDRLKWDGVAVGGGTAPELTAARSALGLGSMATQASNNVSITGGTISGVSFSLAGIADSADATAITIDSSERVGVGTGTPAVRLHAATDDASTATVTDILKLNHSSSGTPAASFGSGLLFSGESSTTDARDMARIQSIWSTATDASRASKLQFQTLTGAGSLTTQMTIDGSGNVGIGTENPGAKLDVSGQGSFYKDNSSFPYDGSTWAHPALTLYGAGTNIGLRFATVGVGAASAYIGVLRTASDAGAMTFLTQGPASAAGTWERMRIDTDGNVGIGTTAPGANLHVKSAAQASVIIEGTNATGALLDLKHSGVSAASLFYSDPDARVTLTHASPLIFQSSGSDYIKFDIDGSIGIGNVAGGALDPGSALQVKDNVAIGYSVATAAPANGLAVSGNVGIGTANPQTTLDVVGQIRVAKNSAQPFACDAAHDGTLALTSIYTMCVCKGGSTAWVQTTDGSTACSW